MSSDSSRAHAAPNANTAISGSGETEQNAETSSARYVSTGALPATSTAYHPPGRSASDLAYGGGAAGNGDGEQPAVREALLAEVTTLATTTVDWGAIDALQDRAVAAYASSKPAGLPHYLEAVRGIGKLRNGMADPDEVWNQHLASFHHERDAALGFMSRRERDALDHAAKEVKATHDFLDNKNLELTTMVAPDHSDRNDFEARAKRDLERAKPIAAFVAQKNGWMVSGGFHGGAIEEIVRGVHELEAAEAMTAGAARDKKLAKAISDVETGLDNYPKGGDTLEIIKQERDDTIKGLDKAGDIVSALPFGPFSKALGIALTTTGYGIQYMSGEMDGTTFWTRTLTNAAVVALGSKKLAGGGSFFAQAVRTGIAAAAPDFAGDCIQIWHSNISAHAKADALGRAFETAFFRAFTEAVGSLLGKFTGGISNEEKRELVEMAVELAQATGITMLVKDWLEKIRELPELHAERTERTERAEVEGTQQRAEGTQPQNA